MTTADPQPGDTPTATHRAAAAYEQLLPEIRAVPESELVPINIDVSTAVSTALGALPRIRALRVALEAMWRVFDFETFDKLESYTLALHHAQVLWRGALVPKVNLPALADELTRIRDLLLAQAKALASYGLIDGERLKKCGTVPGYRPLATDVAAIVEVIRERWAVLENKSPLTVPQLNEFASKSLTLLTNIGLKEQTKEEIGEAAEIRQRAFALFVKAYEHVRRAVLYLRAPQEDGDEIAPSLYANRTRRKSNGHSASAAPQSEVVRTEPRVEAEANDPQFDNAAGLAVGSPFTD